MFPLLNQALFFTQTTIGRQCQSFFVCLFNLEDLEKVRDMFSTKTGGRGFTAGLVKLTAKKHTFKQLLTDACCISTESHGHGFEEVKDYEVVRPVRLHSVRKRDTEVHLSVSLLNCQYHRYIPLL